MEEFLKIILYPLYMIAEFWLAIIDKRTWQKYKFWYILFVVMIVVLVIYFTI